MGAVLLVGCATGPAPSTDGEAHGPILDMGEYAVSAPQGKGWSVEKDAASGSVRFTRQKTWWTGRVLGATVITVMKNWVLGDQPLRSEDEEAGLFLDQEESAMIEMGVKPGLYKLSNVRRETTTLDGRKYYLLRYEQEVPRPGLDLMFESALYLYYPADFQQRRLFFLFLISDSKERGSLVSMDTAQIEPVIRSFQLK